MKTQQFLKAAGVISIAALALTACAANEGETGSTDSSTEETTTVELSGTLNGIGASAQGSAQEAWIAAFQELHGSVNVNYDPQGSGAGREQFIVGASDFAGSDAALSDEEYEGEFASCVPGTSPINLPIYISPIAVVYNVEGIDELNVDAETLAKIFKGDITTWDDEAIAALNPDASLPSTAITPVYRSDDSGTTENFTEYLAAVAPDVWDSEPDGVFPYSGGDGAQGTSGVISAVTNGTGTIGYADASKAGDLGVAKLKVGDTFQEYTAEAASKVVEASPRLEGRGDLDLSFELDRTSTEPGAYPLVLVSYLITCTEYADADKGALVKEYASFIASDEGQQVGAEQAGSAPLSAALSELVNTSIAAIK